MTATFESRTEAYVEWLRNQHVQMSPKITIADRCSSGEGRCVLATADMAEGEVVGKIPRAALLNVRTCSLSKDHVNMEKTLSELSDWEGLILAIMYEWKVKQNDSLWWRYFDVLPLNDPEYTRNQLNSWSDDELESLRPSLILDRIGKDSEETLYAALAPLFRKYVGDVTKKDFNTVASLIMSYSFDLDKEDDEGSVFLKSMVPLADTMNAHTRRQNAYVHEEEDFLVIETTKPVSSGEQIYNTYSVDSNAELLRMYGYVEEQPTEQDVGEISLESIKQYFAENSSLSQETIEEIIQILKEVEDEDEEPFVFDSFNCYASGEVDKELVFMIQFFVVISAINHQKSFNSASSTLKSRAIRRVHKKIYQLLVGEKVTKNMLEHYSNIVKARLSKYPKGCDSVSVAELNTRAGMAEMVLRSEHAALAACASPDSVFDYTVIEDEKLLRNIMKKDVFGDHVSKKQKLN